MNKKIEILCSEDVPEKHLLNTQEWEIGEGHWEDGKPFWGMRRREKDENIRDK